MTSFDHLPLRPQTRAALAVLGISTPTPIQDAALPHMLAGRDVIGQARTGSGKTLAFALPIVERVDERQRSVQALVLTPTRELAAQVAEVVRAASGSRALRVLLLIGGVAPGSQKQALRAGVQVVVGTPGRVLDNLNQGLLRLDTLRLLVLDEADEMLDRGFAPDVDRIIARTNPERQTALFSATVPEWVDGVAKRHLRAPETVKVDSGSQPVENVEHHVYDVASGGKMAALQSLLDARGPGVTLVFGRTKHGVKKLADHLQRLGYPAGALQGNLSQNARDKVMAEFRSGETPILVATNVAARGLDVEHVGRVINYELPETAALLTHRVGRTGRMGRAGEAITLIAPEDEPAWKRLLRELRRPLLRRAWRGAHVDTQDGAIARPNVQRTPARAVTVVPTSRNTAAGTAPARVQPTPTVRGAATVPPAPDSLGQRARLDRSQPPHHERGGRRVESGDRSSRLSNQRGDGQFQREGGAHRAHDGVVYLPRGPYGETRTAAPGSSPAGMRQGQPRRRRRTGR